VDIATEMDLGTVAEMAAETVDIDHEKTTQERDSMRATGMTMILASSEDIRCRTVCLVVGFSSIPSLLPSSTGVSLFQQGSIVIALHSLVLFSTFNTLNRLSKATLLLW
jgi:predicted flavoprotein YhiN